MEILSTASSKALSRLISKDGFHHVTGRRRACGALGSNSLSNEIVTLYRPVGPKELALIEAAQWRRFPPRLPEQPIFYPVLNQEYARQIARDWNVRESGAGFVTRFDVDASFVSRYAVQTVGSSVHQELWVPAEELEDFNDHIVGTIEVVETFP